MVRQDGPFIIQYQDLEVPVELFPGFAVPHHQVVTGQANIDPFPERVEMMDFKSPSSGLCALRISMGGGGTRRIHSAWRGRETIPRLEKARYQFFEVILLAKDESV